MQYRYFLNEFKTQRDLYRSPKNDKSFLDNINIAIAEYFDPYKAIWTKDENKIMGVRNEMFTGWFDEERDEISEMEALKIIAEYK